jgi:hypothetical protein
VSKGMGRCSLHGQDEAINPHNETAIETAINGVMALLSNSVSAAVFRSGRPLIEKLDQSVTESVSSRGKMVGRGRLLFAAPASISRPTSPCSMARAVGHRQDGLGVSRDARPDNGAVRESGS